MKIEILGINISTAIASLFETETNWALTQVLTAEEAIEKFHQIDFDIVVTPDGYLAASEEIKLKKLLSLKDHDSMWITYETGQEHQLKQEIVSFLKEKETAPRGSFSVTDDGFKPRGPQIEIL
ncbi:hypothetical protein [Niabella beijingensis]|uniref:hypothetical protein n=1 Tax=Niabella beijingensis TaxID=2872700 RepID=UPI001CBDAB48|nr:hypothetical protein [Niabella beijingensis]MBZ4189873.1 hypothetical protein [Niabella beijingensis]